MRRTVGKVSASVPSRSKTTASNRFFLSGACIVENRTGIIAARYPSRQSIEIHLKEASHSRMELPILQNDLRSSGSWATALADEQGQWRRARGASAATETAGEADLRE